MKKCLGVALAVIMVGTLTGCGSSKTLKCSQTLSETDDMTMKQDLKFTFNKDEVSVMSAVQTIEVSDDYKSYLSELEDGLKDEMEQYEDVAGYSYDLKTKGNTVTFTLTADLAKMDEEAKEDLSLDETGVSYDDIKKAYEEQGYTCK